MNANDQNVEQDSENMDVEGLDLSEISGWGEYPLDSVFIRQEQRTVSEVVKRIKAERFILHPEFQRDFLWPIEKQSRLIESCLMRLPLPVFYLAEGKDGRIIVVDGLQRLTTFTRYLDDDFALSKLGDGGDDAPQKNSLLGKKFSGLPLNLQERIEDTQLTLYILDAKAPERAKLDIFERVNGGVPLTRQQMRNCLFSGAATRWLRETSESEEFIKATGNSLDKRSMRDREAINRFCAFRLIGISRYKADMDDFLAKALEHMNTLSEQELAELANVFSRSMKSNYLLFGKHAFRKSLAIKYEYASRTVINISLFDVCSVMFANVDELLVKQHSNQLRSAIRKLLNQDEFIWAITHGTNGLSQVKSRFKMMETAISEVICNADRNTY